MKRAFKFVSVILAVILTLALVFASGCSKKAEEPQTTAAEETTVETETGTADETAAAEAEDIGEGENEFLFTAVFADGSSHAYKVHTDKTTVGDALVDLGIIDGEDGPYGLYIKSVEGVTADYDTDGTYWAFYVDGEYAAVGISETEIGSAASYELRVETME